MLIKVNVSERKNEKIEEKIRTLFIEEHEHRIWKSSNESKTNRIKQKSRNHSYAIRTASKERNMNETLKKQKVVDLAFCVTPENVPVV